MIFLVVTLTGLVGSSVGPLDITMNECSDRAYSVRQQILQNYQSNHLDQDPQFQLNGRHISPTDIDVFCIRSDFPPIEGLRLVNPAQRDL